MCWQARVIRDYSLFSDHFPLSPRPWSPGRGLSPFPPIWASPPCLLERSPVREGSIGHVATRSRHAALNASERTSLVRVRAPDQCAGSATQALLLGPRRRRCAAGCGRGRRVSGQIENSDRPTAVDIGPEVCLSGMLLGVHRDALDHRCACILGLIVEERDGRRAVLVLRNAFRDDCRSLSGRTVSMTTNASTMTMLATWTMAKVTRLEVIE